jgi:multicomponent Na+:H+ antiporter subunit E
VAGAQFELEAAARVRRMPIAFAGGGQRSAFCTFSSLMPGTLPTGTNEQGALLVHCFDTSQPVAANLSAEELLFMRAVGFD